MRTGIADSGVMAKTTMTRHRKIGQDRDSDARLQARRRVLALTLAMMIKQEDKLAVEQAEKAGVEADDDAAGNHPTY